MDEGINMTDFFIYGMTLRASGLIKFNHLCLMVVYVVAFAELGGWVVFIYCCSSPTTLAIVLGLYFSAFLVLCTK